MKVKIIEKTHELDLEDEINDFWKRKILKILIAALSSGNDFFK